MALVVDQCNPLGKAVLAQRGRELEPRMAGADDDDRSLRHRDNPTASAQEFPMSSPHLCRFWLARLTRAALVSAFPAMAGPIWPHGSAMRKSICAREDGVDGNFCRLGERRFGC